jgi:hypothetical protein
MVLGSCTETGRREVLQNREELKASDQYMIGITHFKGADAGSRRGIKSGLVVSVAAHFHACRVMVAMVAGGSILYGKGNRNNG